MPWWTVVLAVWLLVAGTAAAESALRLPYPDKFGLIPASTYDTNYNRVGDAHLVLENLSENRVRIVVESGIDGGARTIATAELEPIEDGRFLRLLRQESRSIDAEGVPLGVLTIDHQNGVASCEKGGSGDVKTQRLTLPDQDRVANVPLNLLFQPLVDGSTDRLNFQLLLCRFGARLIDIDARVVSKEGDSPNMRRFIEVEYQPNFGKFVSLIAQNLMPRLSVWFDPRTSNSWIAHRVPLYSKGPEVLVIRDAIADAWLAQRN
ncbi:MAG: hypothetical protein JRG80_08385 [Deltaproteobacteria bacterium]|nr:hypothetical protein [Deltaproteobacteria bacterium]MBW2399277.1 hypothetical protein [Deltaproteobacteria bacterium]MBW2667886.1 hypothetical protein [Deltaproteobacteria bacterium]